MRSTWSSLRVLSVAFALLLLPWGARAQDQAAEEEKPKIWTFTTELTGIWAAGNTESNTFGLDATLEARWPRSLVKFTGGGTQTQSTLTARFAQASDSMVVEQTSTEKTAEFYYLRGRYDYTISPRFFLFSGAGWLRNIFSGIDSRLLLALGAGNTWADTEKTKFKTSYSATYTFQEDVVENTFTPSKFPGVLVAYDLSAQLTQSTQLTSVASLQWNLDDTDDVWIDFNVALPISISKILFFKPAWQLIWRNQPALTEVDLVDAGGAAVGTLPVPLRKTDSFLTLALVVKL